MTDRYAVLRSALAAGPTPGPWQSTDNSWETSSVDSSDTTVARCEIDGRVDEDTQGKYEQIKSVDARYIAAANPATIAELLKELDVTRGMVDRTLAEAQRHAQEARTANATIAEMYQIISGSTGEPGNWHGAEPVRKLVAERDALKARFDRPPDGYAYRYPHYSGSSVIMHGTSGNRVNMNNPIAAIPFWYGEEQPK